MYKFFSNISPLNVLGKKFIESFSFSLAHKYYLIISAYILLEIQSAWKLDTNGGELKTAMRHMHFLLHWKHSNHWRLLWNKEMVNFRKLKINYCFLPYIFSTFKSRNTAPSLGSLYTYTSSSKNCTKYCSFHFHLYECHHESPGSKFFNLYHMKIGEF